MHGKHNITSVEHKVSETECFISQVSRLEDATHQSPLRRIFPQSPVHSLPGISEPNWGIFPKLYTCNGNRFGSRSIVFIFCIFETLDCEQTFLKKLNHNVSICDVHFLDMLLNTLKCSFSSLHLFFWTYKPIAVLCRTNTGTSAHIFFKSPFYWHRTYCNMFQP